MFDSLFQHKISLFGPSVVLHEVPGIAKDATLEWMVSVKTTERAVALVHPDLLPPP